jgi:drug/metabolite transporter (DMT)-like permease
MAMLSTVLPVFWQSAAMQRIGTARAVLIGNLGPILTLFFGWLLGEAVSLPQGGALGGGGGGWTMSGAMGWRRPVLFAEGGSGGFPLIDLALAGSRFHGWVCTPSRLRREAVLREPAAQQPGYFFASPKK